MQNRVENLVKLSAQNPDFQGALITSPQNRFYLLGMRSSAGTTIILKDAAYFIIDFRYIELAQKTIKNAQVILQDKLYEQINEILAKHNVKNLWVEQSMTVGTLNDMQSKLNAKLVDVNPLSATLEELRSIKSKEELEIIKTAQKFTDEGFAYICTQLAAGQKERDMAIELETYMRKQGADGLSFDTILVSGKNSSLPHGVPGDKIIEKGDFITMDYAAAYGGYCTDMTRTVAIGHATDEMKEVYATVLQAQLLALDYIKEGVVCGDVDKVARDYIYSKGYEGCFGHGLGHSVGIDIHESPRFSIGHQALLKEGMVMTVEPGIYLPEKFGVRIEDTVYVTKNGLVNSAHSPKELIIL
ncbi:MAG: aminopeptidase P family protein [Oscillospiraceae bacterium]